MSEKPSGEKTEQPTQKRLDESRQQGQVVRSSDMVTTLATIAVPSTSAYLNWYGARGAQCTLSFEAAAASSLSAVVVSHRGGLTRATARRSGCSRPFL